MQEKNQMVNEIVRKHPLGHCSQLTSLVTRAYAGNRAALARLRVSEQRQRQERARRRAVALEEEASPVRPRRTTRTSNRLNVIDNLGDLSDSSEASARSSSSSSITYTTRRPRSSPLRSTRMVEAPQVHDANAAIGLSSADELSEFVNIPADALQHPFFSAGEEETFELGNIAGVEFSSKAATLPDGTKVPRKTCGICSGCCMDVSRTLAALIEEIEGRFFPLPVRLSRNACVWVHRNCAAFSPRVKYDDENDKWYNIRSEVN
jgi:hypothetical protein